jgi:hypothetical protein
MRNLTGSLFIALGVLALMVPPLSAQDSINRRMQVKKDFSGVMPSIQRVSASPSPVHLSSAGSLSGVVKLEIQMGLGEADCHFSSDLGDGSGKMAHAWKKSDGKVVHYNLRYTKAGIYTLTIAGLENSMHIPCGGSQGVSVTVVQ